MANPPLEARHRPSGLKTTCHNMSFADYIAATRAMLFKAHADSPEVTTIVEGNAPFELTPPAGAPAGQNKPCKRGVLLTHGLTDSPYFMRHLAAFFQRSGFRVMAILLPGHGTQPGDLLDIQWQQWRDALAFGVEQLSLEAEEIYLAGLSTGGTLSVYHSLSDARVRGLFLFSPALRISPRAAHAHWHTLYSWLIPSAKWLSIKPDCDPYKYQSVTKQAVAQIWALTRELETKLQRTPPVIPVFIAASADDVSVDTSATLDFIGRTQHPASRLLLYTANVQGAGITTGKIETVCGVVPEQKILSYAHTSIVLPETDPHYGSAGEYCNCQHYYPDEMEKYASCMTHPEQASLGELTPDNLASGLLRRLMYNPQFAQLEAAMLRFIESLP